MSVKFDLYGKIKKAQREDPQMEKMRERTQSRELQEFHIKEEVSKLGHRLCVTEVVEIKDEIMKEAH